MGFLKRIKLETLENILLSLIVAILMLLAIEGGLQAYDSECSYRESQVKVYQTLRTQNLETIQSIINK